ncbi:MAG: hypothetical protein ACRD2I_10065 [Vicinamibacterales bacterium]
MHLNSGELVDIAEGTRPEASAPHLAGCEPCRTQLRDLRAMMSAASDAGVPEPSPLFWDHLSTRVAAEVAADMQQPSRLGDVVATLIGVLGTRAFQASAVAAAGMLVIVLLSGRTSPRPAAPSAASSPVTAVAESGAAAEPLVDVTAAGDASLMVVASFTDGQDLETVREAGLAPRGTAEHALTHMSESELRELGRLLREELARSGA